MTKKKLKKIIVDLYTELYKEATPSLDYPKLLEELEEKGNTTFDFNQYYLDPDKYEEIVEKHISKLKISERLKQAIRFEAYLGHGPRSHINNNG